MSLQSTKKKVSWARDWEWREGEEERTRARKKGFTDRRLRKKLKRNPAKMFRRNKEDQDRYDKMQAAWMYTVLRNEAYKKELILLCGECPRVANHLQLVCSSLKIEFSNADGKVDVGRALDQFRTSITWEDHVDNDGDLQIELASFFRISKIRARFSPRGQPLSPTDTDESKQAAMAALKLAASNCKVVLGDEGAERLLGLQEDLQKQIVGFITQFGTHDDNQSEENRHRFMSSLDLLATPPAEATPTTENKGENTTTEDDPDDKTIDPKSSESVGSHSVDEHRNDAGRSEKEESSSKRHKA